MSCRPRMHLQVLSGELVDLEIRHQGEAMVFIPVLAFLSDWFQYKETLMELTWEHEPDQGDTVIYASRSVIFESQSVNIETEGEQLDCRFDEAQRFVRCSSPVAGRKRVRITTD